MSRRPASPLARLRQLTQLVDSVTLARAGLSCAGALLAILLPGWVAAVVLWASFAWMVADPLRQEWRALGTVAARDVRFADRWTGLRE